MVRLSKLVTLAVFSQGYCIGMRTNKYKIKKIMVGPLVSQHVLHPVHCRWWLSGKKLTLKI